MPVPQRPFPARVAGSHEQSSGGSGSGAFLDCYAHGRMRGWMGKGESTGQRGIKRQAERKKENRENQARIILFKVLHWSGLTLLDTTQF